MKLFAQCGHGPSDKLIEGARKKLIDGLIFGCRNITPKNIEKESKKLLNLYPNFEILLDPQFYVSLYKDDPNLKEGKFTEWSFFKNYRRSTLEIIDNVDKALRDYYNNISKLPLTSIISPNIFISKSFDSIEASIAKNFIRRSRNIYKNEFKDKREIYCTLAFFRDSLLDQQDFEEFINDLTVIENPPDGFYILLGSSMSGEIDDLFNSEIISNWMLLNFTLSLNGFKVINGYSDIFSTILGIPGAYAGATGWWSNLHNFSIKRFINDRTGGRQPIVKYLSNKIFKRIPFYDLRAYHDIVGETILNGSPYDKDYIAGEPDRKNEIYQTWDAIKNSISSIVVSDDINKSMQNIEEQLKIAISIIDRLNLSGLSNLSIEYIKTFNESIKLFRKKAEI